MDLIPTAAQREAIEAPLGPVLVVAGPGAGKTYCLIERVRYLIDTAGLRPDDICAVTFTNKAAEEVRVRLRGSLADRADRITGGTLHALCVGILREHGETIGIPRGFGIADEPYQLLVLARLRVHPDRRRRGLLILFSRRRFGAHELTAEDEQVYQAYLEHLARRNLLDFDQLIERTGALFSARPDIGASVAARWKYVLIDEFQDLDRVQYAVVKALAPHGNLFVVGDDEQSIFSWRGADPEVLRTFADEYAIRAPIILDRNRRCSTQIFTAARRLLDVSPSMFRKELTAERHSPFDVEVRAFRSEDEEAAWIVDDLRADRAAHGLAWGDVALLYRRHDVGNALEGTLLRAGIPCRLARGRALQDDEAIRYVISALQLMRHVDDPMRFERFAEEVFSGTLIERIRVVQRDRGMEFLDAVREFARTGPRSDPDTRKAWRFVYQVENLRSLPQVHDTLDAIVDALLSQRVGQYRNMLEEWHDELSDPADRPATAALAERLAPALHGQQRVWVDRPGPVRIALLGMLLRAGVTSVGYRTDGESGSPDDIVIEPDPLTLFKALQLLHSREFADRFRNYVAFDLETTDDDPGECEIVELGAVRVRDGEIVDEYRQLVRPDRPVTAGAAETHGYTSADLAGAPRFEDVWPAFRDFVGSDVLVAHNGVQFDVPVLRRMAEPFGGTEQLRFFDSLLLARALFRAGVGLPALAERFGVPAGRAHHALDDARALAAVFGHLNAARVVQARKAALVELLEYVGLGLALEPNAVQDAEGEFFRDRTASYALSRYADCLDFYAEERKRIGDDGFPTREEVIDRLGGQRRYQRLQTAPTPEDRYPEAVARLRRILHACRADDVSQSIDRFVEHVTLSTSSGAEVDHHRVNLLTLHSTKGLEFSRVYIVGVEDHEIPGRRAVEHNLEQEIEEGRRVLYVGMTRARDRLVLTRVSGRSGRSGGRNRFLDEMGLVPTTVHVRQGAAGAVAPG